MSLDVLLHPAGLSVLGTALALFLVALAVATALYRAERRFDSSARAALTRSRLLVLGTLIGVSALTLGAATGAYLIALPPMLLLFFSMRGAAEDIAAGVILIHNQRVLPGDWIRFQGEEGEVSAIELTHVRVRSADGHVVHVPHRVLHSEPMARLARGSTDIPVEVVLPLPQGMPPSAARRIASVCAATSPYASLRQRPQTFVELTSEATGVVRVRGFVFDAGSAGAYRSHIAEAWLDALRTDASES